MSRKLTTEDIKERIFKLVGDEYELLSEYVGARTKVRVKHTLCGCEYMVSWDKFKQGKRCPKCAGLYRYTDNEISELVSEMTNGQYTKLSEYKDSKTKFRMRHETCGCEYMVNWNNFKSGVRCPKCAGTMKLTTKDIKERIFKLVGSEYKLLSEYVNSRSKIKVKHVACGCVYMVSWDNFRVGNRCPFCNQPKGEKFIADYLTNHNISFATQVRFDDCRHKLPLPFDCAVLDDNKRVIGLVEFDGIQHFEPVEAWGGKEKLEITQLRDQIKDDYCKKNGIPLLRIRYDDEDIEEKLSLFLYKLKGPKSQREMEEAPFN